jgi:hypothetical protein
MCCFSRHVESVSNTNIFARSSKDGRQYLVYSMALRSEEDLAMILPIPVPSGSPDDAVKFIDLKGYPDFFKDMLAGFPTPAPKSIARSRAPVAGTDSAKPLPVVEVGSFEASFVPSIRDFSRLDERFRLPDNTWDQLPLYREYGFAVFKLKKGEQKVHPMSFEFPRANSKKIFFPTVHIHDGQVHPKAAFDHTLYCQVADSESQQVMGWRESPKLANQFMKVNDAKGLIVADRHCYQRTIRGQQKNEDTWV